MGASLWSSQIRAKVQSPLGILQAQANALRQQTGDALNGEVKSRSLGNQKVVHSFEIVVPLLDGYRHRVMTVAHGTELIYPATVDAEIFDTYSERKAYRDYVDSDVFSVGSSRKPDNRADSEDEFKEIVAKILQSPYIVSAAQSLIARVREKLDELELASENDEPSQGG